MGEQTPFEQMPRPLCMGSQRLRTMAALLVLVVFSGTTLAETGQNGVEEGQGGSLIDVRVVPASCFMNATCDITQPVHLVEYFSADWCEPCEQVSEQLKMLDTNRTTVLQHHASPADETFLSESKLKFEQEYRLLFIPSLVVDGSHLLTGTRQAMDLEHLLNNSTEPSSALDSLSASGHNLSWDHELQGEVRLWYAEPTPHSERDTVHPSLARTMLHTNASTGVLSVEDVAIKAEGFFVVMLEHPGVKPLTVASQAPTGSMDLSENEEANSTGAQVSSTPDFIIIGVTLALVLMVLPALGMHRSLMGSSKQDPLDKARAEE